MKNITFFLLVAGLALLVGCTRSGDTSTVAGDATPTTLTVSYTHLTLPNE